MYRPPVDLSLLYIPVYMLFANKVTVGCRFLRWDDWMCRKEAHHLFLITGLKIRHNDR